MCQAGHIKNIVEGDHLAAQKNPNRAQTSSPKCRLRVNACHRSVHRSHVAHKKGKVAGQMRGGTTVHKRQGVITNTGTKGRTFGTKNRNLHIRSERNIPKESFGITCRQGGNKIRKGRRNTPCRSYRNTPKDRDGRAGHRWGRKIKKRKRTLRRRHTWRRMPSPPVFGFGKRGSNDRGREKRMPTNIQCHQIARRPRARRSIIKSAGHRRREDRGVGRRHIAGRRKHRSAGSRLKR